MRWIPDSILASLHASGKVVERLCFTASLALRDDCFAIPQGEGICAASLPPSPHTEGDPQNHVSKYGGRSLGFIRFPHQKPFRPSPSGLGLPPKIRMARGAGSRRRSEVSFVKKDFGWPVPRHPTARNAWLALHDPRWTDRCYPPLGRAHPQTV